MSRATFDAFCDELSGVVAEQDTVLLAAIPTHDRAVVCLWHLATAHGRAAP
jgi:hypothetical protein